MNTEAGATNYTYDGKLYNFLPHMAHCIVCDAEMDWTF